MDKGRKRLKIHVQTGAEYMNYNLALIFIVGPGHSTTTTMMIKWWKDQRSQIRHEPSVRYMKRQTNQIHQIKSSRRCGRWWWWWRWWLLSTRWLATARGCWKWRWTRRWAQQAHLRPKARPSRPSGCPMTSSPPTVRMLRQGSSTLRWRLHRPKCWLRRWNRWRSVQLFPNCPSWDPLRSRTPCTPIQTSSRSQKRRRLLPQLQPTEQSCRWAAAMHKQSD